MSLPKVDPVIAVVVAVAAVCVWGVFFTASREMRQCHALLNRAHSFQDTVAVAKVNEHCLLVTSQ